MDTNMNPLIATLDKSQIEAILSNPIGIQILMTHESLSYDHAVSTGAIEDGDERWPTSRYTALKERGRSIMAQDLELWSADLLVQFGFPMAEPAVVEKPGNWDADFLVWMNHDDGNEAGMTIADAVGDPDIGHWMQAAWRAGISSQQKAEPATPQDLAEAREKIAKLEEEKYRLQGQIARRESLGYEQAARRYWHLRNQLVDVPFPPHHDSVWVVRYHQPTATATPSLQSAGLGDELDTSVDDAIHLAEERATDGGLVGTRGVIL